MRFAFVRFRTGRGSRAIPTSGRITEWDVPFLKTLFADGGYQGPQFATALAKVLPHLDVEIVKRSDAAIGFKIIPKRWIVERTIAWLNRRQRLAKYWENLNRKALAFLRLASIRLMLRKLCNPA
jgi:transposase